MKVITSDTIARLNITPRQSVEWVKEAFLIKNKCQLPPKVSIHPRGNDFINTMPCLLPEEYHTFGCKVVSRIKGNHPALKSDMMVFDTRTGNLTSVVNCDWITARRTGAVATLAINTLRSSKAEIYSFIGLGAMAYATLDCLFDTNTDYDLKVRLKRYKDQAEKVMEHYHGTPNVVFEIVDTMEQLVEGADVIVSCITDADGLLVNDLSLFKPGALVVPVHTRGFQNCDTVFDKVFADDEGHVKGFKYFNEFRNFGELSDILSGKSPGRETDLERIISYNIGLGLHDVFFAHKILDSAIDK